jgi:hypothetical protein
MTVIPFGGKPSPPPQAGESHPSRSLENCRRSSRPTAGAPGRSEPDALPTAAPGRYHLCGAPICELLQTPEQLGDVLKFNSISANF